MKLTKQLFDITLTEICVDGSCCLRGLGTLTDLPALDLVLSGSEEVDEVNGFEASRDDLSSQARYISIAERDKLEFQTVFGMRVFP